MTRRRLDSEDIALWRRVTENVQRLHPDRAPPDPQADWLPAEVKAPPPKPRPPPLPAFEIGTRGHPVIAHDLLPPVEQRIAAAPLQMDAKAFKRLKRGKLDPEARIDLHGMTLSEAHPELIRFILNAHSNGMRLVLVITGKGKPGLDYSHMPQRTGVLRQQVPHWLRQPPCGPVILQVTEAHLRHGGSGAYYIYLRRFR